MRVKKPKSKRVKASQRYKIEKKVAEHNRKERKLAKKDPTWRSKIKKDPGVPNLFPYKDQVLAEVAEKRRQVKEEKEARQAAKKNALTLVELANDANKATRDYDKEHEGEDSDQDIKDYMDPATSGQRDNSRKAYYREVRKVVENSDVILEILDARDPLGCRAETIEKTVMESGPDKRIVLVLNKIDLVPRENVESWLKYLRNYFPTIAFKASTQSQRNNLSQKSSSHAHAATTTSECIGADALVSLLKNYQRNKNIKTSITVGVVGFPNVGKSSVINSLKRARVCGVGSTPGLTKVVQEIHLDKGVKLLDCPGVVFAENSDKNDARKGAEVALRNAIKVEQVEDPIIPVELILERCNQQHLMILYNIPIFYSSTDFLVNIARQRGRLRKGGIPDLRAAAQTVLADWNNGRIPYYTIPPSTITSTVVTLQGSTKMVSAEESAEIVKEWSKEFDLAALLTGESDHLAKVTKSQSEFAKEGKLVKMQSSGVPKGKLEMAVDHEEEEEEEDGDISSMDEEDLTEDMQVEQEQSTQKSRVSGQVVSLPPKATKNKDIADNSKNAQISRMFTDQELNLMPQTNKIRKKALKKARKDVTRSERVEMAVDDEPILHSQEVDNVNDDYDFGPYFGKAKLKNISSIDKDGDLEM